MGAMGDKRSARIAVCVLLSVLGLAAGARTGAGPADPAGSAGAQTASPTRPNVVIIFPDNLGWGEVGVYGGVRGSFTPRIDRLAAEGIRFNNFNVEPSCTVSRAALLTGRYAIRTGATQGAGMTLWEVTIAEALKSVGYATALFGKWHVGGDAPEGKREPTHQGFDEYYGIPRTSNEAQTGIANGSTVPGSSFVWEGKVGQPSRNVKPYDMESRRTVDRESAERGVAFMERSVRTRTPFFLYYPMTQIHFPTLAHPDFAGKTGAGDIADAMADTDYNTGLVLDTIDRLGITRDTIVFWCPDNGAEARRPWRGSPGPWSGFYNTVMEGGIRTPCIVRWPGRIPAGRVTNELIHEVDIFPTIAAAVGADIVPRDRAIDGVNQLPWLEGRQARSNRDSVIFYLNTQLRAVKWHDWKLHYVFQPEPGAAAVPPLMRLFDLLSDPREESDVKDANPWARSVMDKIVADFAATTERYPHVPPNAPDPYEPGTGSSGRAGSSGQATPAAPMNPAGPPVQVPDFAGRWTASQDQAGAARGGGASGRGGRGDMGSGWGSPITITQDGTRLTVEYAFFARGDMQPPLRFVYALDGSPTTNSVMMGRGLQSQTSTTAWSDSRLVITTTHTFVDPAGGRPSPVTVPPALWLDSPSALIVETTRAGVLGGPATTTRTTYGRQ
jgi:arylsulfatase A-like enzyme